MALRWIFGVDENINKPHLERTLLQTIHVGDCIGPFILYSPADVQGGAVILVDELDLIKWNSVVSFTMIHSSTQSVWHPLLNDWQEMQYLDNIFTLILQNLQLD